SMSTTPVSAIDPSCCPGTYVEGISCKDAMRRRDAALVVAIVPTAVPTAGICSRFPDRHAEWLLPLDGDSGTTLVISPDRSRRNVACHAMTVMRRKDESWM